MISAAPNPMTTPTEEERLARERAWRTNVGLRLHADVGAWFEQHCAAENRTYANFVETLIQRERQRLAAALSSLPESQPREAGWRDIADAPRDGPLLLRVHPADRPGSPEVRRAQCTALWDYNPDLTNGLNWGVNSEFMERESEWVVTHWQPLPSPDLAAAPSPPASDLGGTDEAVEQEIAVILRDTLHVVEGLEDGVRTLHVGGINEAANALVATVAEKDAELERRTEEAASWRRVAERCETEKQAAEAQLAAQAKRGETAKLNKAVRSRLGKAIGNPYDGGIWEGGKFREGPYARPVRLEDLLALLAAHDALADLPDGEKG